MTNTPPAAMSLDEIASLIELEAKATPAPWEVEDTHELFHDGMSILSMRTSDDFPCIKDDDFGRAQKVEIDEQADANEKLIAALRNATPQLLALTTRLAKAELEVEEGAGAYLALSNEMSGVYGKLADAIGGYEKCNGKPVHEAAIAAMKQAEADLASAVEGLESIVEYWNSNDNNAATADACETMRRRATSTLAQLRRPA